MTLNTGVSTMHMKYGIRAFALAAGLLCLTAGTTTAQAFSLTRGTPSPTPFDGAAAHIPQVNYVADNVTVTGAFTSGGLVSSGLSIAAERIQYDMLNPAGNTNNPLSPDAFNVIEYTVHFPVGTTVIGASAPSGFVASDGTVGSFGGSAFTTLFDTGFGVYDYNTGSGWKIHYNADSVSWFGAALGGSAALLTDSATGAVNAGGGDHFVPTFELLFAPGTTLGLNDATIVGLRAAVTSIGSIPIIPGQTLSAVTAVPLPLSAWLFASALGGLAGYGRRRAVAHG
jgi:hypothetical protein